MATEREKKPLLRRLLRAAGIGAIALAAVLGIGVWAGAAHYEIPVGTFVRSAVRSGAGSVLNLWYREDSDRAESMRSGYWTNASARSIPPMERRWREFADGSADIELQACSAPRTVRPDMPFVYVSRDSRYLVPIRSFVESRITVDPTSDDEYGEMLRLATWVGTLWDHGDDAPPAGTTRHDTLKLIEQGQGGAKYWCELAACSLVHVASARGWIARLVTLSRDGYTWEHAVVDLWSNQFGKWFMVDTDFNLVYESDGVPLSSVELCHEGVALHAAGKLSVRPLGAAKASLPRKDLLPFFEYVFVDLRTDWLDRSLPSGSPAGGDLATWWTARPGAKDLLTIRERVVDPREMDWPVQTCWFLPKSIRRSGEGARLELEFGAYGPDIESVEYTVDNVSWTKVDAHQSSITLPRGTTTIRARARGRFRHGFETSVRVRVP